MQVRCDRCDAPADLNLHALKKLSRSTAPPPPPATSSSVAGGPEAATTGSAITTSGARTIDSSSRRPPPAPAFPSSDPPPSRASSGPPVNKGSSPNHRPAGPTRSRRTTDDRGHPADCYLPVRSRCLHPGQQQGRRWPSSSSSSVRRMRRSRVISCLASSTQQMNSLRARGVMSLQASRALRLAISALRRSPGSLCTTPPGTRGLLTAPR